MRTTKTFEQKRFIAFRILLWILAIEILGIIILGIYQYPLLTNGLSVSKLIVGSIIFDFFLIRWMNQHWFNLNKVFCKVFDKTIPYDLDLTNINLICKELRDNPDRVKLYMEQWNCASEEHTLYTLLEEKRRTKDTIDKLNNRLNEIKASEHKTLHSYVKAYLWR